MLATLLHLLGIPTRAEIRGRQADTAAVWRANETLNAHLTSTMRMVKDLSERVKALESRYPAPPWRLICDAPGCGAAQTPGIDKLEEGWTWREVHGVRVVLCGRCRSLSSQQVSEIGYAKQAQTPRESA